MRKIWSERLMVSANAWALVGAGLVVVFGFLPAGTPDWVRILGILTGLGMVAVGFRQLWLAHVDRLGFVSVADKIGEYADRFHAFFLRLMKVSFGDRTGAASKMWQEEIEPLWKESATYLGESVSTAEKDRLEAVIHTEAYVDHAKDNRGEYYVHVLLLSRHLAGLRGQVLSGGVLVQGKRYIG